MEISNGAAKTGNFETAIETLEISTAKLDSKLSEIPSGYYLVLNAEELHDKLDESEIMKQPGNMNKRSTNFTKSSW